MPNGKKRTQRAFMLHLVAHMLRCIPLGSLRVWIWILRQGSEEVHLRRQTKLLEHADAQQDADANEDKIVL